MKLCIYGAGGFGKEVYDIAFRINKINPYWEEILFVVDAPYLSDEPYKGRLLSINNILKELDINNFEIIIANGEPVVRRELYIKIKAMNIKIATLVDPSSIISDTASLGEGVIVAPLSIIASSTVLGRNVAINTHTTIGHDITIGEHSVVSTHVTVGGSSVIGADSFIGLGVQTKEKLSIGSQVIIGMGAVVFKDIPDNMIAMGNPARSLRRNEDNKVFK
jgi:sugar O-acyltransferase (sialic acid O-acetyltransferase NeuD family)